MTDKQITHLEGDTEENKAYADKMRKPPRRLKAFYLDTSIILDFFRILSKPHRGKHVTIPEFNVDCLPDDARVISCEWSLQHMGYLVIIESEEFDEVIPGMVIPIADTGSHWGGNLRITLHTYDRHEDGSLHPPKL